MKFKVEERTPATVTPVVTRRGDSQSAGGTTTGCPEGQTCEVVPAPCGPGTTNSDCPEYVPNQGTQYGANDCVRDSAGQVVAGTCPGDGSTTASSIPKAASKRDPFAGMRPKNGAPLPVQQQKDVVSKLDQNGDKQGAYAAAAAALKEHPEDKDLLAYVKLNAPVKEMDTKDAKARAEALKAGLRQDEGAGNGALMATPIAFGAMGAGAPGALPPVAFTAPPSDARGLAAINDAKSKIGMKDYAGAESALSRRLEQNPSDISALDLRAILRHSLGRFNESADDARRALALDARDIRALHLLAKDLLKLQRPQEAKAEADRALAIDGKDAEAFVLRGHAWGDLGKGEEQLADYARAASLDAAFDDLYHGELAKRSGGGAPAKHSWAVWLGAIGTALLFFSFALFRKRGDSSVRIALRKEDDVLLKAAAPVVSAVPKGFKVVRTLGQGGMGVVYEAVDLGLQRTVALKKLRAEVADNARERGRFLKEARTVAALKHPNIVEIHAIHEDAEGLFLVFERVPGESLHDRLGRGPLSAADAALILRQVAAALDYAHGQGVVHQDLKPANVMIHGNLAKVMDFGIARRVAETMSTLSKIEVAGTPAYMSPEQEQGQVTPAADVFALGAFAYESLTGALPYPTGALMMKAQKMYRKPSDATPGLKPGVDAAIARALEPRPEDRWPSATSFIEALARSLS